MSEYDIKTHTYEKREAYCLCEGNGLAREMIIFDDTPHVRCPKCDLYIYFYGKDAWCEDCNKMMDKEGLVYICPNCESQAVLLEKEIETVSQGWEGGMDEDVTILDCEKYQKEESE